MARATLSGHLEVLEQTVTGLTVLPNRVGALEQSLDGFRKETQREFAMVRQEMADGFAAVPQEMAQGFAEVRSELRAEIRDGGEETRRQMLMLHEDLIGRIKTIGEGIDDLRER